MDITPATATATLQDWTLYVAPSDSSQCRVYAMPYPMRPGQAPRDLNWEYQKAWQEIGLMRADYRAGRLELVCLSREFQSLIEDIRALGAGEFVTVQLPVRP